MLAYQGGLTHPEVASENRRAAGIGEELDTGAGSRRSSGASNRETRRAGKPGPACGRVSRSGRCAVPRAGASSAAAGASRSWTGASRPGKKRFALLALRLKPVTPSADVWPALQRRIGSGSRGTVARARGRHCTGRGALASAGSCGRSCVRRRRRPEFASASGETALARRACGARRSPRSRDARQAGRAGCACARAVGAARGRRAGIARPDAGKRRARLALDDRQRAALKAAANIAVSDEPAGGSPTGAPTGDVLYIAAIVRRTHLGDCRP